MLKSNGLKKNLDLNCLEKLTLIDQKNSLVSLSRQAQLLDISRSSLYYQPVINPENIAAMNAIDEIYTRYPFYGSRRIKDELENYEIFICREHVQRLMRKLGLEAIYPKSKPNLSKANNQHKKYPYLLKKFKIVKPNQVWGADITYIRLQKNFAYLVAILDWYSRYVVSWRLSRTLEPNFCIQALTEALKKKETNIHNSDQGVQFTDQDYVTILQAHSIQISMDGRGRCMDNIFTERLWRTVKYENVYLNEYLDFDEARSGLNEYFSFYNQKRRHSALPNRQTPAQIYFSK